MAGSAAGNTTGRRRRGLAKGVGRRATAIRTARISEPAAGPARVGRAGGGNARAALQSRRLARRGAAARGGRYAAPAIQTEIAQAARISVASTSSTNRPIGARLAEGVGGGAERALTAPIVGATAVAASSIRTCSGERAGTSASTGGAGTAYATPAIRTRVACATELTRTTAGWCQGSIGASLCGTVFRVCTAIHWEAINWRTIRLGTIRLGTIRWRAIRWGAIRWEAVVTSVAVQIRVENHDWRSIACAARVGIA